MEYAHGTILVTGWLNTTSYIGIQIHVGLVPPRKIILNAQPASPSFVRNITKMSLGEM